MTDTRTAVYAQHDLIQNKARLQHTAEGLQEITLSFHFHYNFCIPEEQYDQLNNARQSGEILPLIWGTGFVEGNFVIISITRKMNSLADDGSYISITCDVTLKEFYDPNKPLAAQVRGKRNAFAAQANRPVPVNPAPVPPTPAVAATKNVQQTNIATRQVDQRVGQIQKAADAQTSGLVAKAQAIVDRSITYEKKLTALQDTFDQQLAALESKLSQFPVLATYVPQLGTAINTAQAESTTLRGLITQYGALPNPVSTLIDAQAVVDWLRDLTLQQVVVKNAMKEVNKYAQPLSAIVAARLPLFSWPN